jgi:hypothetical protein
MFKPISFRTAIATLLAPLTLAAIAPQAAQAQIIIINPSPYPAIPPQPQSGTFIYGSPIPTPIPVNPVTGQPTIFDRRVSNYPTVRPGRGAVFSPNRVGISVGGTTRRTTRRTSTIIVNPTIINPSSPYYYDPSLYQSPNSYFYYDSSGNIQLQLRR